MSKKKFFALSVPVVAWLLAGCGITTQSTNSQWLSVDAQSKTVTLVMDAGYNTVNDYDNFDGYANGQMVVTVPQGYKVKMQFSNDGGIPADIGVYTAAGQLAFPGAGDSVNDILENPTPGLVPGDAHTYTFVASTAGSYKIDNLINRFPQFSQQPQQDIGMWAALRVVPGATPMVQTTS